MLQTEAFVDSLAKEGISHVCAVPCSFATPFINALINSEGGLHYVPCASEAVACSVAVGLRLSGKRPLVFAQSSGLTNMGSCITSLLKPYGVFFPMIVSWRTYREGDPEIQHRHLAEHLPDLVAAYGYTHEFLASEHDEAVQQVESGFNTPKILLLTKDHFSPIELEASHQLVLNAYPRRMEYLELLNERLGNTDWSCIGTTGHTAREMAVAMPDTHNFYMAGNMGGALSVGLGAQLAGRNVLVCGGDAECVMHLGGLTTAARYVASAQGQLVYVVFDNESNKSTGGQKTLQAHISYQAMAEAGGMKACPETITDLPSFSSVIGEAVENGRFNFLHVKCSFDDTVPRPDLAEVVGSVAAFQAGGFHGV